MKLQEKQGYQKVYCFINFKNKKSLYQYVYQYCLQLLVDTIDEAGVKNKTDFFEIMRFGADKKNGINRKSCLYYGVLYESILYE